MSEFVIQAMKRRSGILPFSSIILETSNLKKLLKHVKEGNILYYDGSILKQPDKANIKILVWDSRRYIGLGIKVDFDLGV